MEQKISPVPCCSMKRKNVEICKEAYKSLPNQKDSQIAIINGAAHAMLMERPYYKIFRERILEFLKKK